MSNSFLSFFQKPNALPDEDQLKLTAPDSILDQYTSQLSEVPELNTMAGELNTDENQGVQQQVGALDPSFIPNVKSLATNTTSMLNGQIPQDVIDQITRNSAYQSLSGGFGDSGMAHALTSRDLGLTSLDLQSKGAANLGQEANLDSFLTPGRANAAGMLLSPGSLQEAQYTADQYNNQIQNQNNQINYQNSLRVSPFSQVVSHALGSVVSAPFNFVSNYADELSGGAGISAFTGWTGGPGSAAAPAAAAPAASSGGGGAGAGILGGLLGGGGGAAGGAGALAACCFIFLESLNGDLPWYVRRARDTRGSNAMVRGYRWMSRWLVPAMRTWKPALSIVNLCMVKPMLAVGEDYYTPKKSIFAKLLKPVVAFWFIAWAVLGLTFGLNERGRDAS